LMNISKHNDYLLAISWSIASTLTALVFMPKFRELNCTSAYEVFRYSFFLNTKIYYLVFRKTF
jgi:hypothetical protein